MRRQIELWEEQKQQGRDVYPAIVATVQHDELQALDDDLVDRLYALLFGEPGQGKTETPGQRPSSWKVTDLAEAIRGIVGEVLRRKELSNTQSLLSMGLNSISATQIATRLETLLNREIPPQVLLECSTIGALAERFRVRQGIAAP